MKRLRDLFRKRGAEEVAEDATVVELIDQKAIEIDFAHKTAEQLSRERRHANQVRYINALRRSREPLKVALLPHAFGVMLGLQYYGIFSSAEVQAFRNNITYHGGKPTLVEELMSLIAANEKEWWLPLLSILSDLQLTDMIEVLQSHLRDEGSQRA